MTILSNFKETFEKSNNNKLFYFLFNITLILISLQILYYSFIFQFQAVASSGLREEFIPQGCINLFRRLHFLYVEKPFN